MHFTFLPKNFVNRTLIKYSFLVYSRAYLHLVYILICFILYISQVLSEETRNNIRIHFEQHDDAAISYLLIKKADFTDSGTYKCDPANAEVVSIRVNVLNGMQF